MAALNRNAQVDCELTHQQVAEILTARGYPTTAKVAWHLEHQALRKIASDPMIKHLAEEMGLTVRAADSALNCG